mgnify:FL=1
MIRLEGVFIKGIDGEPHSFSDSSFPYLLTDIEEDNKDLFDLFSLHFESFEGGKILGDDFSISKQEDFSHLFYLSLDVKDFAKLGYVFEMGKEDTPLSFRKKIIESLKDLKEKQDSLKGEERLQKSLSLLKPFGLLYVLLDGSFSVNKTNWKEIRSVLLCNDAVTFAFLPKESEPIAFTPKKKVAKVQKKEEESHLKSGIASYLKEEVADLLFLTVFSLLSSLGFYCGVSFCYDGNALYASLSLVVGAFCFLIALDVLASFGPSLRKFSFQDLDIPFYEFLSFCFVLVGGVLGIGASILLTNLDLVLEKAFVLPLSLIISILSPLLLALFSFVPFQLEKVLERLKLFLGRKG